MSTRGRLRSSTSEERDPESPSLILSKNSLHIPGHVLLPAGSLLAHPFPSSVHPAETHPNISVSDMRNGTAHSAELHSATQPTAVQNGQRKQFTANSDADSELGEDKKKKASKRRVYPQVIPLPAAVVCLVFNVFIPGSGKTPCQVVFLSLVYQCIDS